MVSSLLNYADRLQFGQENSPNWSAVNLANVARVKTRGQLIDVMSNGGEESFHS
jgi:hypothetical protein